MAIIIPTIIDLYGSEADAVTFYKALFTTSATDPQLANIFNLSFSKIDPIFGQFREYTVGEDTLRNEHIKRAVAYEVNSIEKANVDPSTIANGGLNMSKGGNSNIISEKMGNITTSYGKSSNGGLGGLSANILSTLGLLSVDASVILSRYIRKSFGMGVSGFSATSVNAF